MCEHCREDGGTDALNRFHIFQRTTLLCVNVSLIRVSIILSKEKEIKKTISEKNTTFNYRSFGATDLPLYLVHIGTYYIIRHDSEETIHRRRQNESILHTYAPFERTSAHSSIRRWNIFRIFTFFPYQSMKRSDLSGLEDITS